MQLDYIVVGGGSTGCVVAHDLIMKSQARVLLLDQGRMGRGQLLRMPAGSFQLMNGRSPYLKQYLSAPQPRLGNRRVPLAQANIVGGGSAINMMAYTRGSRRDYALWDEISGGAGWSWDDLIPYLRAQEGNQRLDNEAHGGAGPMKVSDPRYVVDMTHHFMRTLQRMGLPYRADLHDGSLGGRDGGVGFVQTTTFKGRRCSAADAFLAPILDHPRLTVLTEARATRVLLAGERATGVEYLRAGRLETAAAAREVVLTAGALVTPKLLMLSGIGPAQELARHGIALRRDLPGVGRNLQDHAVVAMTATTEKGLGYSGEERGPRMVLNALRYLLFRDGPVASNGSESMAYVRVDDREPEPDLQLYCVSILSPHIRAAGGAHGVTLLANLLRPRSRGTVTLASADPADDPVIDLNWLSDPDDVATLVKGLRYLREVLNGEPLASIVHEELFPGAAADTDEALAEIVRLTAGTNYHPCGTCRMGRETDGMAVLTPDLRVKGVEALRVLDASMMPNIISTNLNATAMAVAAKGVDLMVR